MGEVSADRSVILEPSRQTPVVGRTDVLVVGGGPAGLCAAIAAARNGVRVILTERYGHLGGLASGGEVIVLDDMADLTEKPVAGLCDEFVERLDALGAAVYPPQTDQFVSSEAAWARWGRWGLQDNYARTQPKRSPTRWHSILKHFKFVALEMLEAAGVDLRLHSTFADTIVDGGALKGAIFETKAGR